MLAVDISDLHLTYPTGFKALKGIDLEVNEGDFFALLGPMLASSVKELL